MSYSVDQFEEVYKNASAYQKAFKRMRPDRQKPLITMTELSSQISTSRAGIRNAIRTNDHLPQGELRTTGRKERVFTINEANEIRSHFGKKNPLVLTRRPPNAPISVVTITGYKGGIKKTSTAVNLATFLSVKKQMRVLLIDMDGQGSASSHFMDTSTLSEKDTFSEFFSSENIRDIIRKDEFIDTLDIIPANSAFESLNMKFTTRYINAASKGLSEKRWGLDWWELVPDAIEQIKDDYDVVIIDTAPNMNLPTLSAIWSATHLIMPVPPKSGDINSIIDYLPPLIANLRQIEDYAGRKKIYTDIRTFVAGLDKSKNEIMADQINKMFAPFMTSAYMKQSDAVFANEQHYMQLIYDISDYVGARGTIKSLQKNFDELFSNLYTSITKEWVHE
ncbi:MAG: ParA family protein [Pseudomonadota bacterium]|nr:ParA family protein [Pseudomonadota bacterium]